MSMIGSEDGFGLRRRCDRIHADRERLREALTRLVAACDNGRRSIKPGCGVGGMTIEANIKGEQISGIDAWAVEEARAALSQEGK